MGKLNDILQLAQERAQAMNLPYAGALTPAEAYDVWQLAPGAMLVDIRTRPEWEFVGRIPGAVEIEWELYPNGAPNPNFFRQMRTQVDKEAVVLLICRSGNRSDVAGREAARQGYASCYNVLEGFEGDRDANEQRGKVGGWKLAGLPWFQ
jgi:rhodanese-related sulfurtransferase